MKRGVLTVISGFSGAGKGTLIKALLQSHHNYQLSVSATTRKPREGEIHGREYFFLDREEFERRIERDEFIEYANYVGNYYGTPKDFVLERLEAGQDVLLEIEVQGAKKIRESFPEALLIFIAPPSAGELKRRLFCRETESAAEINKRLLRAAEEARHMEEYEYLIVNDDLEAAVCRLHALIGSRRLRIKDNREFIREICDDILRFKEEV